MVPYTDLSIFIYSYISHRFILTINEFGTNLTRPLPYHSILFPYFTHFSPRSYSSFATITTWNLKEPFPRRPQRGPSDSRPPPPPPVQRPTDQDDYRRKWQQHHTQVHKYRPPQLRVCRCKRKGSSRVIFMPACTAY